MRHRKVEELRRFSKTMVQEPKRPTSDRPIEVTDATFTQIIESYPLVVVDCWAPWCTPCHILAPIIKEMAKDYSGKILFGKLNIDENQNVATKYQIMSIPTLLVFKNGKLVDQIVGAKPRQILEHALARYV